MAFSAVKGYLYVINALYMVLGLIIVAVAAIAEGGTSYTSSLPVLGGIIAAGVFLMAIAGLGMFATYNEKRGLMFAYTILLSLLFIIQFSVSIAALTIPEDQRESIAESGWCQLNNEGKNSLQIQFSCYGVDSILTNETCMAPGEKCPATCQNDNTTVSCLHTQCPFCERLLADDINRLFKHGGGVGLAFSFTELIGVWASWKFRKLAVTKEPTYQKETL